jgi:ipoprotein LpqH
VENRFVTIAGLAVLIGSIAGCSSEPSAPPRPSGALPQRTAQVTVGENNDAKQEVSCVESGSVVTITTGDDKAGTTSILDKQGTLTVRSVAIRNLDGFTGSYWQDLGPTSKVSTIGTTYEVTGTADGFNTDKPSFRTTRTFSIKVGC